jgi:hypothetical protein
MNIIKILIHLVILTRPCHRSGSDDPPVQPGAAANLNAPRFQRVARDIGLRRRQSSSRVSTLGKLKFKVQAVAARIGHDVEDCGHGGGIDQDDGVNAHDCRGRPAVTRECEQTLFEREFDFGRCHLSRQKDAIERDLGQSLEWEARLGAIAEFRRTSTRLIRKTKRTGHVSTNGWRSA